MNILMTVIVAFCFQSNGGDELPRTMSLTDVQVFPPQVPTVADFRFKIGDPLGREEITSMTLAIPEALNWAADRLVLGQFPSRQSVGERLLRFTVGAVPLAILELPLFVGAGFGGDWHAYQAFGMDHPRMVNESDFSDMFAPNPFNVYGQSFKQVYGSGDRYASTTTLSDQQEFLADSKRMAHIYELFVATEASRINQGVHIKDTLSEKILDGYGHVFDFVTYLANWLSMYNSGAGSYSYYKDYVEFLDIYFDRHESVGGVKRMLNLPWLASNSFISLSVGLVDFALTGDRWVEPLKFRVGNPEDDIYIFWPEMSAYLTLYGTSFKFSQRVDWKRHSFWLELQHTNAESVEELGVRWRGPITGILNGEAFVARSTKGGVWLEAGPMVDLFKNLQVGGTFSYGRNYTPTREEIGNDPYLKEREFSFFLEVRLLLPH